MEGTFALRVFLSAQKRHHEVLSMCADGHKHSFAYSINSRSQIVGCLTNILIMDVPAGFLWQDGVMYDLNKLIPPGQNVKTLGSTPPRLKRHTG
jgi:probable HAF family extracellular repeat protein